MPKHFEGNEYIIEGNITKIKVYYKDLLLWAIIDTEDLQKIIDLRYKLVARYRNYTRSHYVQCNTYFNGKHEVILLHQIILNHYGKLHTDHINNNPLDNRKENLRIVESNKNMKNRKGRNSNNTTGFRNVCFYNGKYIVQLQVDGKNKVLGKFDTAEEAGAFAELKRKEIYGEFAGKN